MSVISKAAWPKLLSTFEKWLSQHPIEGDKLYGGFSVRYQVARYCEYLDGNPWQGGGNPMQDPAARDGAVAAYEVYLATFNVSEPTIRSILTSLDHFYVFLGLGAVGSGRLP